MEQARGPEGARKMSIMRSEMPKMSTAKSAAKKGVRMRKSRVLSTVSAVALTAGIGLSANAATAPNLLIDLGSYTITVTGATGPAAAVTGNDQINLGGSITDLVQSINIGVPVVGTDDIGGSANNVDVDNNTVFSEAFGNTAVTEVDVAQATGITPDNGAVAGSLQVNDTNTLSSTTDDVEIRIVLDGVGADDSLSLTSNSITSETVGNTATTAAGFDTPGGALVTGDVPLGYTSTEEGQVQFDNGAGGESPTDQFEASASYVAGSAQINTDATLSSVNSDNLVTLLVNQDGGQDVEGTPMVVDSNTISSELTGNDGTTGIGLTNGLNVALDGSAAVANLQVNTGGDTYNADTLGARIEVRIGDGTLATDGDMVDSDLEVTNNTISADAQGNSANNFVTFEEGLSQNGPTTTQDNSVTFNGTDFTNSQADLIVSSVQVNDVDVTATIGAGVVGGSRILVDTEGLDGSDVTVDGNAITASAGQNEATNTIDVGGAPTFDSSVAVNNLQYATGQTISTNEANLRGDIAGEGQTITESSVSFDDNTLSSTALGNAQSSSAIIRGTNVVSDTIGGTAANILVDRPGTSGDLTADLSVLSTQVVDGSDAAVIATQSSSIVVDVTDDSADFLSSQASISNNDLTVEVVGNLATETSLTIDSTNIDTTAAVANVQTIEDGVELRAENNSGSNTDHIDIDVGAATITDVEFAVNGNEITSTLFGNLADASTNSLVVTGTSIGDRGQITPNTLVDRFAGVPPTGLDISSTTAGFSVHNNQSIEDLNEELIVSTVSDLANDEDLITILFEGPALGPGSPGDGNAIITTSSIQMNENLGSASAQLNAATSELIIDAAAGLNASSALTNVQTVAAENTGVSVAGVSVILEGGFELKLFINGDITDSSVEANENELLASAGLNEANNRVSVSATNQVVEGLGTGVISSLILGEDTETNSEISLVNDQYFDALGGDVDVNINGGVDGRGIDVGIGGDNGGDLVRSPVTANGNVIATTVEANVASNEIDMDIGSFNLDAADTGGGALRGPVATIASNQRGVVNDTAGGFSSSVTNASVQIDLDTGVGAITEGNVEADGNTISAFGRVNAVENTLIAEGNTFLVDGGDASIPEAELLSTTNGGDLEFFNSAFAIGSRQQNGFSVSSLIDNADIDVSIEVDTITDSVASADGNLAIAQARGSDSVNTGGVNFNSNQGQMFVGNVQLSEASDPQNVISAIITNTDINVDANQSAEGGPDTVITDSALTADGNSFLALSSANRTSQVLDASGTNIESSFVGVPSIDATPPNPRDVIADFGIVNHQGAQVLLNGEGDVVTASVNNSTIEVLADEVISGAISVDGNTAVAGAILDSASNAVSLTALANVAGSSSAVYSQQFRDDASSVLATAFGIEIGSVGTIGDISSDGAVGISVDANRIGASATVGSAANSIAVSADAAISGNPGIVPAADVLADGGMLNADHSVFNLQLNLGADATAIVGADADLVPVGFRIGAEIGSDALNDAISIDDNLIEAIAEGFASTNTISLNAGSSSVTTAQVANRQETTGATILAAIVGGGVGSDGIGTSFDGGVVASSATVNDNTVAATAQTNQSTNVITSFAEATFQNTDGVTLTIAPGGPTLLDVDLADYAVLNSQATADGATTASIGDLGIGIGLAGALDDAALTINGNQVLATSIANDALNVIGLDAGTSNNRPSVAVANLQTNTNQTVSSTISNVNIGVAGIGGSANSTTSVSGNTVGSTSIGNRSFNSIGSIGQ